MIITECLVYNHQMLSTFWWVKTLTECLVYNHDVVYILVGPLTECRLVYNHDVVYILVGQHHDYIQVVTQ